MNSILDKRFAVSDHAISSPVGDETVILQTQKGTYFGLDPVATRIFAMLKDGLSPALICQTLATDYEVEPAVIEADVRAFLAELEGHAIIAGTEPPPA